jgi:hypothetical protein
MRRRKREPAPVAAPRSRSAAAVAIDALLGIALTWGASGGSCSAMDTARSRASAQAARWMTVIGPSSDLVREQIGSPGQRLLGIRTVDRRTGARVDWWRSLTLAAMSGVGVALSRASPQRDRELEVKRWEFRRELQAAASSHAGDPEARAAAIRELDGRYQVNVDLGRRVGLLAALGLLRLVLRRRLAPTTEISVRTRR